MTQFFKKILPLILFAVSFSAFSQTEETKPRHEISIGIDVLDFPTKGYNIWLEYRKGQNRFFFASGKSNGTDAGDISGIDDFGIKDEYIYLMRFGYTRFIFNENKKFLKGIYLGGTAELYQRILINTNISDNDAKTELLPAFGLTLGYQIDLGKHIGIQLWTNPRFLVGSKDLTFNVDGGTHIHEKITYWTGLGVNVNYRFGL